MTVKPGWRGRTFEDFEVGEVYEHPIGRAAIRQKGSARRGQQAEPGKAGQG